MPKLNRHLQTVPCIVESRAGVHMQQEKDAHVVAQRIETRSGGGRHREDPYGALV